MSISPGITALTVMPCDPSSSAADFISPMSPHFDAEYAAPNLVPCCPWVEEVMTIRPPPRRTSAGANTRSTFAVPVRFTSIWSCQSASSISRIGRNAWMPALANDDVDAAPRALDVGEHRRAAPRCRAGRAVRPSQRPPAAPTSRPVSSRSSGVAGGKSRIGLTGPAMSTPTTSAPACASATAAARPMPRAAPVTTATFPSRVSGTNTDGGRATGSVTARAYPCARATNPSSSADRPA